MTLVEAGTRALVGAIFGPTSQGETGYARRLPHLRDGSYLTMIGTVKVRIIDVQIAVTCADGTVFTGSYRLATTLTDARRYPAATLTGLYHQRWEHGSAHLRVAPHPHERAHPALRRPRRTRAGDAVGAHALPTPQEDTM
ncbi:hypothetical protein GCM10010466_25940 [Planomonospora alba]|uniref:Uncharacterized protein n=2 Tax=Planomonospora alba TaxID=161354 RepID=A0ABP6N2S3_9ACTN